jgi:branched-chain amino acid transport system permease protein
VFGVIVATIILTLMPEFFRFISDYKLLVYGTLLFAVMRFAPEGLAGLARSLIDRIKPEVSTEKEVA